MLIMKPFSISLFISLLSVGAAKECDDSFMESTTAEFRVLSTLFHEPLVDRTQVLGFSGLKTRVMHPIPEFNAAAKDRMLGDIARARATEIWSTAKESSPSGEIEILFSGGIDSTAALVAMLETAPAEDAPRLVIKMAPRAIGENPLFYENFVEGKLPVEMIPDADDICQHVNTSRVTLT